MDYPVLYETFDLGLSNIKESMYLCFYLYAKNQHPILAVMFQLLNATLLIKNNKKKVSESGGKHSNNASSWWWKAEMVETVCVKTKQILNIHSIKDR